MTDQEKAIQKVAEASVKFSDKSELWLSELSTDVRSSKEGSVDSAMRALAQHIALTAAAELVKAEMEPTKAEQSMGIPSTLRAEIARLNRVIEEKDEKFKATAAQSDDLLRFYKDEVENYKNLRDRSLLTIAKMDEQIQGLYADRNAANSQSAEPPVGLDPCRTVTWAEWHATPWSGESPDKVTHIVRSRVAESVEGMVPKSTYSNVVRRLAAEAYPRACESPDGYMSPRYAGLCKEFGVDPYGDDDCVLNEIELRAARAEARVEDLEANTVLRSEYECAVRSLARAAYRYYGERSKDYTPNYEELCRKFSVEPW